MRRVLLTLGMFMTFFSAGYGQNLSMGDIGIIGVSVDNEEVLLVALTDITAGEIVFITDEEWNISTFNSGEGFYEWVTPSINKGDVFTFKTVGVTGVEGGLQGTVTAKAGSFALANSGDGVFIYQTSTNIYNTGTYTFIGFAGKNSGFAGTLSGTSLTIGLDAIYFDGDNGKYDGIRTGEDQSGYLNLIYDSAEWSTSGTAQTFDNSSFIFSPGGGTPTKLAVTTINNGASPSTNTDFDVVVQLQDADDNAIVATKDTTVTLTLASGNGALGGTLSGTISSGNNSVTFSGITYNTAESGVSITASNTGGSLTAGTSSTFEVLSAADQLVLIDVPTSAYVGESFPSFTVEARRSGDNSVDLNYTKSITVSIATGTGTIGGTTTQSSTNGVATFNDITIDAAGSFTIEATDGSLSSTASSGITISAATIVINEIMADPTGIDSNGDGTVETSEDEYVEFVNTGDSNLDISSWTIEDGSGLRHTFAASTILQPLQAVVVFGGGVPTGNFGDALVFTASLGLNNTGDDVILKDDQGAIVVSYTYGLEGGDDQSITRSPDLTGTFAKHTAADTDDASSFSPGTKLDGSTFQASTNLNGAAGFRLLSAPSAESYGDLLDNLWTQGASAGADVTNGDPNVYIWDNSSTGNTNTNWSGLTNLTGTITAGEGFLVYVFADDDLDGVNDAFPKLVSSFGAENAADASPTINSNADGWTLLGNPFNSTIDFDNLTTNDITDVAYVYNPATTWVSWNGSIGDLTDGLVAPFQGFFVQTASSPTSASVSFPAAAKTTGGSFYGKVAKSISYLRLEVEGEEVSNSAWIQLSPEGSATSKVYGDALELKPLSPKYAQLGFIKGSEVMDIAHIAASEEVILPIEFNSTEGGTFKISSTDFTIPTDLEVWFHDYQQEVTMVMDGSFSYSFETEGLKNKDVPALSVLNAGAMPFKSTESNRFGITIRPTSVSSEIGDIPLLFGLDQNYPNPFNPSTTIGYSIKEAGAVSISVYNLMGQKVATLVDEHKSAGQHNIRWNAAGVSSGMYYYRLEANGKAMTRKMTLIK